MKRILLILALIMSFAGFAQDGLWTIQDNNKLSGAELSERASMPYKYSIYKLDLPMLKNLLQRAPSRESGVTSDVIIGLPDGNGKLQRFRIYEASVLDAELAAKHPEIGSYAGQGVDDATSSVRFSVTRFGLHTMMFSSEGTSYTDTYTKDLQYYISYNRSDLHAPRQFGCAVVKHEDEGSGSGRERMPMSVAANDGRLRRYRLALASTVEYSAFHINAAGVGGGTLAARKEAVLNAMAVTMTRVNFVYERDLAVTMQIIANNANLIFVTSDTLNNNDGEALINQIQAVINSGVGSSSYDIGHVFSTGGGGIAALGSVCGQFKGEGVTGSGQPVGDPYDIDYVAHEMGHQFGGNHTFNANASGTGSCQGNREPGTAVEPGGGTTIMSYAGICGSANIQSNSDAYFHAKSLDEMFAYITTSATCGQQTNNNNTPPVIPALTNYTIPKGTPFVLKGSATDANGDALTYCWEQTNAGGNAATTPTAVVTNGPVFRSYSPTASPNRYFPALPNSASTQWEVLPSVARTLSFALTVRDNRTPNGGQTARQDMSVTVNANTGPFTVTSQNTAGISYTQGSTQTVTWNVANTTAAPINTANVNILLSTDGGLTYPTVLLANTPNDGTQTITIPNVAAPYCRFMVESVGNIFYSINSQSFSIGGTVSNVCNTYTFNTPIAMPDAATELSVIPITVPINNVITDVNATVSVTHTALGDLHLALYHPDQTRAYLWNMQCGNNDNMNITFDDSGSAVVCASPSVGVRRPVETLSAFNGKLSGGQWLFGFADAAAQDIGTLNSVSLEICSQQFLSAQEFAGLDGFVLYPNPNNGNFNVDFTSTSGADINIAVHDMRGRQVYGKQFANTGVFSGNINLEGMQSGVYLVTVEDGGRKETRKVVVQ